MFWHCQKLELDESFPSVWYTSTELRSTSSYGHFTAALEFWPQCRIYDANGPNSGPKSIQNGVRDPSQRGIRSPPTPGRSDSRFPGRPRASGSTQPPWRDNGNPKAELWEKVKYQKQFFFEGFRPNGLQIRNQRIFLHRMILTMLVTFRNFIDSFRH